MRAAHYSAVCFAKSTLIATSSGAKDPGICFQRNAGMLSSAQHEGRFFSAIGFIKAVSTGCAALFLDYLCYQLNFAWPHVAAAEIARQGCSLRFNPGRTQQLCPADHSGASSDKTPAGLLNSSSRLVTTGGSFSVRDNEAATGSKPLHLCSQFSRELPASAERTEKRKAGVRAPWLSLRRFHIFARELSPCGIGVKGSNSRRFRRALSSALSQDLATFRLFVTEKTSGTPLARIFTRFLSAWLSTTPSRSTCPFLTMIRMGFTTGIA